MKRKFLTGVLSVLLYFTVALSMISVTYAWLCYGKGVDLNVKGTAIANYFHSGTGTENDPYILTTPRHVYNLAWLQYLGTFNDITGGKLNSQVYFELGGNINMADGADTGYQTIPPIGTSEYPFLGNFDGKGFNISNAIVANKIGSDGLVAHPPVIDDVRYSEIIGFFGIVGDYTGAVELTSTQLKALEVKNLTLTDVTIKTSTTKSLAGLFAGYVNGNISNINVVSGDITVNSGVLPYTETLTETNIINNTLSMSKYALIGDYHTTRINWVGGPGSVSKDSGDDTGWGGSIDMLSLAKRITFMLKGSGRVTTSTTEDAQRPTASVQNAYHLYGITGENYDKDNDDYIYNYNYNSNSYSEHRFFLESGSYLPLNINQDNLTETYYSTISNGEDILPSNTGYFVGTGSGQSVNIVPFVQSRLLGQVCYSLQGSVTNWQKATYSDNALQILTRNKEGDYIVIGDSHNGLTSNSTPYTCFGNSVTVQTFSELNLTQYEGTNNVRGKLGTLLTDSKVHGIVFQKAAPSMSNLLTNVDVSLGSLNVNSLAKGTVHFNSDNKGVITMVAATLYQQGFRVTGDGIASYTVQQLPMLYQITRNSNGDISAITPIKTICVNASGEIAYNISAGNGWETVFDYDKMGILIDYNSNHKAYMNSLFYFELPINGGEYVIGGYSNIANTSYPSTNIIYLDIGANAGDDLEETPDDGDGNGGTGTPEDSDEKGTIEGVAFAYKSGNLYVQITKTVKDGNNQDVAIVVTFDFSLKDKSSNAHTGATAKFTGTAPTGSGAASVTTSNNNTGQFTITENDTGSG